MSARLHSQRFAIIGDFGSGDENELKISAMVSSWNPDFIITLGDNNYYEGSAATIDANIGRFYSVYIYPYYGSYGTNNCLCNRFFPSLGNHDVDYGNIQAYYDYFTLPGNERYYDFVKGDIHFFALNSNPSEPDGVCFSSKQSRWLREKLSHSTERWKIVYFHHAPYSSGYHGSSVWMQWPFAELGVHAVFSGHEHSYERLEIDSLIYFVNGCGGALLRPFTDTIRGSKKRYSENFGAQLAETYRDSIVISFFNANDSLVDHYVLTYHPNKDTTSGDLNTNPEDEKFFSYPNPFKGSTTIQFSVNKFSSVKLMVYNSTGELVKILADQFYCPGTYFINWYDEFLVSGVYYIIMIDNNKIKHSLVTKIH